MFRNNACAGASGPTSLAFLFNVLACTKIVAHVKDPHIHVSAREGFTKGGMNPHINHIKLVELIRLVIILKYF